MIVLGDISGIQNYLFDVADAGGGQARRLRARSFFLQVIPDLAAIRVARELGWSFASLRMAGAGKFVLQGAGPADADSRLRRLDAELSLALLSEARGEVRLSLAWSDEAGSEADQYRSARSRLQQSKSRPWSAVATRDTGWDVATLVLLPLDTPCELCRHQRSEAEEWDDDAGVTIQLCGRCKHDGELGRSLPRARWLIVRNEPVTGSQETLGLHWEVSSADAVAADESILGVANLAEPEQPPPRLLRDKFWKRRLMCRVPTDPSGVAVWFEQIAKQSRGDALLGVLKADADSVGSLLETMLAASPTLGPLSSMSRQLDDFFAGRLKDELDSCADWQSIYTVFGGGDDLLLVGPWHVMFDFAEKLDELFQTGFKRWGLTLSAGLALAKWKRPVKFAAEHAEELLDQAKQVVAVGEATAKDQLAALGQVWKWKHHRAIFAEAKKLTRWVDGDIMPRGWLHSLLELAESRFGDPVTNRLPDQLATARLAHHVARNYRRGSEVRRWGDDLVADFDTQARVETRYLPAILRYALTATRNPSKED
jgi:CRISPR-associated protein Csm1